MPSPVVYLALFLATSLVFGGDPQAEESEPITEIQFCDDFIAEAKKKMNLTFYSVYRFQVDQAGRPVNIQEIKGEHVDSKVIHQCLKNWTLLALPLESTVDVAFHWEHGVGCTEMVISGEGLRMKVTRPQPTVLNE